VLACYSTAEVATAVQVAIAPEPGRPPVEQCAALWSDGRISSGGAPTLTACVTDTGIVAVLPGDDRSCLAAGWVVAASSTQPPAERSPELTNALSDRFAGRCLDVESAGRAVEDVLVQLGLTGWAIDDRTPEGAGCAVPVVDVASRTVALVSLPE
jgi:hypothetical protein